MNRIAPIVAAIGLVAGVRADDPPKAGEYNAKVAEYAKSKLGEKVGNGDCSTLIQEALREAGAKVLLEPAADGEYLWGEPLKSYKEAKPGDIVQFENVVFSGKRRGVGDNGAPAIFFFTNSYPHHSAIVTKVGPGAKTITIHHQNAAGPDGKPLKIVQESVLTMSQMRKGGSFKIYRPIAPE